MTTWARYGANAVLRKARQVLSSVADVVWPPVSPLSGDEVGRAGALSAADWSRITFIDAPQCACCGVPFPYPVGEGAVCGVCAARAPAYDAARAAFVYDDESRRLVLGLKHGGRTDMLAAFGRWMARAGGTRLTQADMIIPVPLHPRRLRQRRFNQSLLLAQALSHASGLVVQPHILRRRRATASQGGRSAKGRARNVAGAFDTRASTREALRGARVVLVDDVHTTGATLEACARALKRAGAADVTAITLARVVKPADPLK